MHRWRDVKRGAVAAGTGVCTPPSWRLPSVRAAEWVGEPWSARRGGEAGRVVGAVDLETMALIEEASQRGHCGVRVQADSVPGKRARGGSGARLGWGGGGEDGGGWLLVGRRRRRATESFYRRRRCWSVARACPPLRPHGPQHARLLCPHCLPELVQSLSVELVMPSNHLVPVSSCLQFLPASGSFPVSRLFASGGQSIAASASVFPKNIQGPFPLAWTGWISLQSRGLPSLLQHHSSEASTLRCSAGFMVQL